jgi:hypothetical protein
VRLTLREVWYGVCKVCERGWKGERVEGGGPDTNGDGDYQKSVHPIHVEKASTHSWYSHIHPSKSRSYTIAVYTYTMSEAQPTVPISTAQPEVVAAGEGAEGAEGAAGPTKGELKRRAKEAEKAKKAAEREAREAEEKAKREAADAMDEAKQNYGKLPMHQSTERNGQSPSYFDVALETDGQAGRTSNSRLSRRSMWGNRSSSERGFTTCVRKVSF